AHTVPMHTAHFEAEIAPLHNITDLWRAPQFTEDQARHRVHLRMLQVSFQDGAQHVQPRGALNLKAVETDRQDIVDIILTLTDVTHRFDTNVLHGQDARGATVLIHDHNHLI